MAVQRLCRPCQHDRYDPHLVIHGVAVLHIGNPSLDDAEPCPGGEFLPEDALAIWWCEIHESQKWLDEQSGGVRCCWVMFEGLQFSAERCRMVEKLLCSLAASQVGEPGTTGEDA